MKTQTTIKIIGLVIVILFILAIPKEKEKQPLKFDSSFLIEAEKIEHLIEFTDEETNY
jgi:hypothetical protein